MKRVLPIGPALEEPVHQGRPRNVEPSSSVSTWLPAGEHDKLIRLANEEETSVSALVRRLLRLRLR
jgi:hypothetical protein